MLYTDPKSALGSFRFRWMRDGSGEQSQDYR